MQIEMSGLLASAGGVEPPRTLGGQVEFLFAQQLVRALSQHTDQSGAGDGENYLAVMGDHLAAEVARAGLGIRAQIDANSPAEQGGERRRP